MVRKGFSKTSKRGEGAKAEAGMAAWCVANTVPQAIEAASRGQCSKAARLWRQSLKCKRRAFKWARALTRMSSRGTAEAKLAKSARDDVKSITNLPKIAERELAKHCPIKGKRRGYLRVRGL